MSFSESRFQALAVVSLQFTQAIRENLPIKNKPWLKAGQDCIQVVGPLQPIFKRLGELLHIRVPAQGPFTVVGSGAWHRIQAEEAGPEQQGLLMALDEILSHYSWDVCTDGSMLRFANNKPRLRRLGEPWSWPDIPPIGERLLSNVDRQAARAGARWQRAASIQERTARQVSKKDEVILLVLEGSTRPLNNAEIARARPDVLSYAYVRQRTPKLRRQELITKGPGGLELTKKGKKILSQL
jgi:hypothetical protein